MASVGSERAGIASGINNAVARVASLLAVAVLGIAFVWSHDAALSARLDRLHLPHQRMRVLDADAQSAAPSTPLARAQADAIADALRAVAALSAVCAFAAAGVAAATIRRKK
jgi:Na+/melibiose symporter-like transporter